MSEWREYILEDVIDKFIDYRGKTPTKTTFGIPLVTAKIVKAGKILPPNEFIAREDYDSWMTRGLPEIDDVVLTTEAPLGEVALIQDKNVALAQRIITLRGKKEFIFNPFLKYYFQNDTGQHKLQSRASGTTVFGIKASVLRKMPVELPDIEEQKAIASVLSSLDDKIDLLHRQNKTLEAMAETLFRQWFVEEVEDDWVEGTIYDLIEFNPARKLAKGEMAPYLEMAALSTNTFNPDGWYLREFSSGTKFTNGDTLLARITPCLENGKTAYVTFLENDQVAWGSTEYIVMRPKGNLHPFFAYSLARNSDFRDYAEGCLAGSSGRQRVDVDHLKDYKISTPSATRIKNYNAFAESITLKLHANSQQIHTLKTLRDTLLPKLMSGEVRVEYP
ncbi:restriction endonuclease subunit S [Nitrosomonas ureae]|uniref:Type I restriction enzyme, S subunit n=1 Tax=Nitrosomonas ureae TaxID=44577 RepID=A0A1H9CX85_9PROT|nr:restriction endonuclease subunit S [Nitrosomonas ureae]SEQ05717.1 type I restriction enzyme, S subunit [Nitrosomonas ureae]